LDADLVGSEEQIRLVEGTNPHEGVTRREANGEAVKADMGDVIGVLQAVAGLH
jgi:hypothetical protein